MLEFSEQSGEQVVAPEQPSIEEPVMAKKKVKKARQIKVVEGTEPAASKMGAIESYLRTNPDAKNAQVVEALMAEGIVVTTNYVSLTRGKMKGPGKKSEKSHDLKAALLAERKQCQAKLVAIDRAIDTLL